MKTVGRTGSGAKPITKFSEAGFVPGSTQQRIENIVFVGGSNARALSYAGASLGVNSDNIATGGWKLTRVNVDKLIPDLKDLMSSLPAGMPVVLFCLDHSSFLAATEEGGLIPISKCLSLFFRTPKPVLQSRENRPSFLVGLKMATCYGGKENFSPLPPAFKMYLMCFWSTSNVCSSIFLYHQNFSLHQIQVLYLNYSRYTNPSGLL